MNCEITVNFSECRNETSNLFFLTNGSCFHLTGATDEFWSKLQAKKKFSQKKIIKKIMFWKSLLIFHIKRQYFKMFSILVLHKTITVHFQVAFSYRLTFFICTTQQVLIQDRALPVGYSNSTIIVAVPRCSPTRHWGSPLNYLNE